LKRAALVALLVASACDDSPQVVDRARRQYQALLEQAAEPSDSRFDVILGELAKVKPNESGRPEADRLRDAIVRARSHTAPAAPLAAGGTTGDAELDALKAKCVKLAGELGALSGDARTAKVGQLEDCKRELLALDAKKAHDEERWDAGS
jgi:hypothetical protein